MGKKTLNFKSKRAELNWIRAVHSIPSSKRPDLSVAEASPGNTPIKIKGKSVKVNHKKKGRKK